jgi:transposase
MDIELASYVLHFKRVLFTIKLLHKCFYILCSLCLIGWLCVLRWTCRQVKFVWNPFPLQYSLIWLSYRLKKLAMSYAKQTNNNGYNYELFED